MTTFRIVTLGCKVNQYESSWLREALCSSGWEWEENGYADVTVINTCIVTQRASRQSRQEIRKAIRSSPGGLVAAVGCFAQVFPDELSAIDGVGLIVGNSRKGNLVELLEAGSRGVDRRVVAEGFDVAPGFDPMPLSSFPGRSRAFLKIQDGCKSFCTYCIVPFARGPSRSLGPREVLRGIEAYCNEGYREIVLTGIHLGHYRVGTEACSLAGLLRRVRREKFPARIRLSSIEPNEISEEIIGMVAEGGWICRHLHIPLQSGDNGILRAMNRHYTAAAFAGLIRRVHDACPRAGIGVDVMCGFPGESAGAFENTRGLISDLPVSYLHVFPFSARPGTRAATFDCRVEAFEIKTRTEVMRAVGEEKRGAFFRSSLGSTLEVLREGWRNRREHVAYGTSDNYVPVTLLYGPSADPYPLSIVRADRIIGDRVEGTVVSGKGCE
jgi:threonylcarbamoyladenosine tRNA methylthiotransferase MtaB